MLEGSPGILLIDKETNRIALPLIQGSISTTLRHHRKIDPYVAYLQTWLTEGCTN
jgi:hypothetical protein